MCVDTMRRVPKEVGQDIKTLSKEDLMRLTVELKGLILTHVSRFPHQIPGMATLTFVGDFVELVREYSDRVRDGKIQHDPQFMERIRIDIGELHPNIQAEFARKINEFGPEHLRGLPAMGHTQRKLPPKGGTHKRPR